MQYLRSLPVIRLATLIAIPTADAALYETIVQTQYGPVQGYPAFNSSPVGVDLVNWADITVWKGIPFAASTAGQNRFRQPQRRAPWNSTLDAQDFGDTCPGEASGAAYTLSEDCLNLNIWSAANSTDAKLPVVLWSHPAGSASRDALFDGGGMADKGIVFVNYNYRTGVLGWLAHPELSEEFEAATGSNSSGNWAMLDQFAALAWIRENIEAFGGDPDHIIVQGQSAGAAASYHILNSPLTKGQFVGAIIESGVRDPHDPQKLADGYITLAEALSTGIDYLGTQNVTTIDELREIPWETLVGTGGGFPGPGGPGGPGGGGGGGGGGLPSGGGSFSAVLDYYAVPGTYLDTLVNGLANDVPVITGNARDENGATYGLSTTLPQYLLFLNQTYEGEWVDAFWKQYPANDSVTASNAENQQWIDRSKVGTWLWSRLRASNTTITSPVYNYLWDHAPPGRNQGAYHESEINYVLNNLYATDLPWEAIDYEIAAKMNGYWVNFVKTGNPNGGNMTTWDIVSDIQVVQELGGGWDVISIGSEDVVQLLEDWFQSQPAY